MSYQKCFIWCQTSQFSKEWLLCKKICTTMMMFTVEKDHLLVVFCWRLLLKTPMTSTRRNSDGGKRRLWRGEAEKAAAFLFSSSSQSFGESGRCWNSPSFCWKRVPWINRRAWRRRNILQAIYHCYLFYYCSCGT